ncbi:hypothetical protein ERJ75_000070900 [Trypanosoma vivax]|nr:hypothetical protein ERJ75_000070900 [Trypanosoma vivax]
MAQTGLFYRTAPGLPQGRTETSAAATPRLRRFSGTAATAALFKGRHSSRTGSAIVTDCVADHAAFRLLMEDVQPGLFDLIHVQRPLGGEHRVEEELCGRNSELLAQVSC